MHLVRLLERHHVGDEFSGVANVDEGILQRHAVRPWLQVDADHWRSTARPREEGDRRQVRDTFLRQSADPADRTRGYASNQELIGLSGIERCAVDDHVEPFLSLPSFTQRPSVQTYRTRMSDRLGET